MCFLFIYLFIFLHQPEWKGISSIWKDQEIFFWNRQQMCLSFLHAEPIIMANKMGSRISYGNLWFLLRSNYMYYLVNDKSLIRAKL